MTLRNDELEGAAGEGDVALAAVALAAVAGEVESPRLGE